MKFLTVIKFTKKKIYTMMGGESHTSFFVFLSLKGIQPKREKKK